MGKSVIKVGDTSKSTYGQTMTVIRYGSCSDIDVQFEDGTIVRHKTCTNFKSGKIRNPNFRLQKTAVNNSGHKMEIVEYNTCEDILVKFEDGTLVKSRYKHFISGRVKNPNEHIGETYKLVNGDTAKIVQYNDFYNVTVKLTDGTTRSGVMYRTLQSGSLGREWRNEIKNKQV